MLCIIVKNARIDAPLCFPFLWRYCFLLSWSEYLSTLILFCSFKTQKNHELNCFQACPSTWQDSFCALCCLGLRALAGPRSVLELWSSCRSVAQRGRQEEPQQVTRAAGAAASPALLESTVVTLVDARGVFSSSLCAATLEHFCTQDIPPALACFLKLSSLPPALR